MLVDGADAFPAMLAAIHSARRSIWLESYIFETDRTGREFVAALTARARAGVEVKVIVDAFGSIELYGDEVVEMQRAGVRLVRFGRLAARPLQRWIQRDHRKLLIVDGELAFLGGININDDYAPRSRGGKGWHDIHISVSGRAVAELEETFAATWKSCARSSLTLLRAKHRQTGRDQVAVLSAGEKRNRTLIRGHLLHAIHSSTHEVLIANAYFVPDRVVLRALEQAAGRGVDVRLLVPAHSDVVGVQWAGEQTYSRLMAAGVSIHPWPDAHMHAKAAVVDGVWAMLGSYNLDYVSLLFNLELCVEVVGPDAPEELALVLRRDTETAPPLDPKQWKKRGVLPRLRSQLAYRLRRWL